MACGAICDRSHLLPLSAFFSHFFPGRSTPTSLPGNGAIPAWAGCVGLVEAAPSSALKRKEQASFLYFGGSIKRKISTMFLGFLLVTGISVSLAHNSSTEAGNSSYFTETATRTLFAQCPDTYSSFCYHGTCRFLLSELEASCVCFKGYIGIRCEHVDLLQVMAAAPPSFLVVALSVTFLAILTLIGSTCLVIYFCRVRRERNRQTLLKNIEQNDV
ncbi:PREDICTED: protransforming growth factor alpha-like [Nanorana parkeri]|uniref:protransforming growth factor alpha-like n=1 Tax=Nanorana parkeri TaxID=125878 RepID=UPI0008546806|nr:PREDICTED: protransforming growth factor alpha-like [Nanorana parkeri]